MTKNGLTTQKNEQDFMVKTSAPICSSSSVW